MIPLGGGTETSGCERPVTASSLGQQRHSDRGPRLTGREEGELALPPSLPGSPRGFSRRVRPGSPFAAREAVPAPQEPFTASPSGAPLAPTASPSPVALAAVKLTVRGPIGGRSKRQDQRGSAWVGLETEGAPARARGGPGASFGLCPALRPTLDLTL